MQHPGTLKIEDYTYDLPADRIAAHPLPNRDDSKLLIYKRGEITEDNYKSLAEKLPHHSMLVFNDTKVIPARILFQKETGASIEIFCLEPYGMNSDYATVMSNTASSEWKCMIGGAAKWKSGALSKIVDIDGTTLNIQVVLTEKLQNAFVARFTWTPAIYSFAEVIHAAGAMPLPPYIKRAAGLQDTERYQTIYAQHEGSVAAPTAGLHFTNALMQKLKSKEISDEYVTLHVGAGTFKPVKAEQMSDHHMHAEWLDVDIDFIQKILSHHESIIAVGTTATRTLESIYWMGVKAAINPDISKEDLEIKQWDAYNTKQDISKSTALAALITWMEKIKYEKLFLRTALMIAPGYKYRVIDALVTNFHQPASTLLLLVAAAVGDDWKKIYNYALENNFRFLSYGDGSLIWINK